VVRRVTQPDIPNAVGKNLEGDSWIIVPTWRGNTKGTRACTKSVGALKMLRSFSTPGDAVREHGSSVREERTSVLGVVKALIPPLTERVE